MEGSCKGSDDSRKKITGRGGQAKKTRNQRGKGTQRKGRLERKDGRRK